MRAESTTKNPLAAGPPAIILDESHEGILHPSTTIRSVQLLTSFLERAAFFPRVGQLLEDQVSGLDNRCGVSSIQELSKRRLSSADRTG
jgi:hypothetical protein